MFSGTTSKEGQVANFTIELLSVREAEIILRIVRNCFRFTKKKNGLDPGVRRSQDWGSVCEV